MKNINKYLLAIILFITFTFVCMSDVKAAVVLNEDCKNYISVDVKYEGSHTGSIIKKRIYRDGKENIDDIPTTRDRTVIKLVYGKGGKSAGYKFSTKDKLIIGFYTSGGTKLVKECTVSNFDTTKGVFTATIKAKKSMWVDVQTEFEAYFSDGSSKTDADADGDLLNDVTFVIDEYDYKFPTSFTTQLEAATNDDKQARIFIQAIDGSSWGFDEGNKFSYKLTCTNSKKKTETFKENAQHVFLEPNENGSACKGYCLNIVHDFYLTDTQLKGSYNCTVTYNVVKQSGHKTTKTYKFKMIKGKINPPEGTTVVTDKKGNANVSTTTASTAATSAATTSTKKGYESVTAGTTNSIAMSIGGSTKIDCGDGKEGTLKWLIDEYWRYIMIAAPVLLIVMMSIEVVKAMVTSDADLLKKLVDSFVKRTLATIILLCLPVIIRTILEIFGIDICL